MTLDHGLLTNFDRCWVEETFIGPTFPPAIFPLTFLDSKLLKSVYS